MPRKLKKNLGLVHLFAVAAGAMISSGLFILPGLAYAKSGPAMIAAYMLASLFIIPVMLSVAELATAIPKAGGNYFFIDRSMGPVMGFLGGCTDWLLLTFKGAFSLVGMGLFLILLYPDLSQFEIKMISVVFCLLVAGVNLIGVQVTGRFQLAMVIMLLTVLISFVAVGSSEIQTDRFIPFAPFGGLSILETAAFIFISYAGITKAVDVSEEVQNPGRNIPLALLLAWGVVSSIYVLVLIVTVGTLPASELQNSLTPISLAASTFWDQTGAIALGFAAILAFATTANASLLTASRAQLAMSRDNLIPKSFKKLSKSGTPTVAILCTTTVIISIILLLSLENLVKAASTLILLLFIFLNLSLIIMRESKIHHYRPKFNAPLYPYVQIVGILIYTLLIYEIAAGSMLFVVLFLSACLMWYFFFARQKIEREYGLLHIIQKIRGIKKTNYLIEEELREILIERDDISAKHFTSLIKNAHIIDYEKLPTPFTFSQKLIRILTAKLKIPDQKIIQAITNRKKTHSAMIKPGVLIESVIIPGHFDVQCILIRCKKCGILSAFYPSAHSIFVIVSPSDKDQFYLHTLLWLTNIIHERGFSKKWLKAKDNKALRQVILSLWKKRDIRF